jgi:hypothetical protein
MPTVYGQVTHPLFANAADLILRSNAESNVACLSEPDSAAYVRIVVDRSGRVIDANDIAVLLHFLGSSTGIADGSYYQQSRRTARGERAKTILLISSLWLWPTEPGNSIRQPRASRTPCEKSSCHSRRAKPFWAHSTAPRCSQAIMLATSCGSRKRQTSQPDR